MAHKTDLYQVGKIFLAVLLGGLTSVCLDVQGVSASFLPLPGTDGVDIPVPEGETAFQKLENILGPFSRNLRIIVGAVAVLFIVISGFTMVISGDNEETAKKEKKSMTFGIIGLMMISIAGPIAEVFDYRQGNFINDPEGFTDRVQLFSDVTQLVITFIKYLLGSLATLMAVRAGAVMVLSSDNEDEVTKAKKSLALSAGGLFMVVVSSMVIQKIFYVASYSSSAEETIIQLDQNELVRQLSAFANILVSFVGPVMMFGIVIGGFLYVTAGGDEERTGLAKKIIMNSIIGIIIIYGAFALVSTVIAGQF